MKWFVLATIVVLVVAGCVPLFEERQEFVVEVAGRNNLNEVMKWYEPSYSNYVVQTKPVIILYYGDSGDFITAGGEYYVPSSGNLGQFLFESWESYEPIFDVDILITDVYYEAIIKGYKSSPPSAVQLIKFARVTHTSGKYYYLVTEIIDEEKLEPIGSNRYRLGKVSDLRGLGKGFAVVVRGVKKNNSKGALPVPEKIIGAEVVWPE